MSTLSSETVLTALQQGRVELQGEFLWGSNYTFLLHVEYADLSLKAVYKPTRGVRPLWDFPAASLARREVAAYLLGRALGWDLVPPTVLRKDAPLGPGSIQLFIEHDPEYHYFNFSAADRQRLRPVVVFDILANNADRKGSHILLDPERRIWLIDHGICFHVDEKLRTVIWDFAGEPIPPDLYQDVSRFRQALAPAADAAPEEPVTELALSFKAYLSAAEIRALIRRADLLLAAGCFPNPDQGRRQYPWPPI